MWRIYWRLNCRGWVDAINPTSLPNCIDIGVSCWIANSGNPTYCQNHYDYIPRRSYPLLLAREVLKPSLRPHYLHTTLKLLEEMIVVELRTTLLLPLDDLLVVLRCYLPLL
jgi:hypothetical protein